MLDLYKNAATVLQKLTTMLEGRAWNCRLACPREQGSGGRHSSPERSLSASVIHQRRVTRSCSKHRLPTVQQQIAAKIPEHVFIKSWVLYALCPRSWLYHQPSCYKLVPAILCNTIVIAGNKPQSLCSIWTEARSIIHNLRDIVYYRFWQLLQTYYTIT